MRDPFARTARLVAMPDARARDRASTSMAISGFAVACATACTNPIDVVKTHAQATSQKSANLLRVSERLIERRGVRALAQGLGPALTRAVVYGGARLGGYEPVLRAIGPRMEGGEWDASRPRVWTALTAGATSGAMASAALNPTELIKTRMQREGGTLREHLERVVREGGMKTLWRGSALSVARSATLTATQVATYGEAKRRVVESEIAKEGVGLHFAVAMVTGLVTTATTNPVDMVKTRVYVADGSREKPSVARVVSVVLREHGPLGFLAWIRRELAPIRTANGRYVRSGGIPTRQARSRRDVSAKLDARRSTSTHASSTSASGVLYCQNIDTR